MKNNVSENIKRFPSMKFLGKNEIDFSHLVDFHKKIYFKNDYPADIHIFYSIFKNEIFLQIFNAIFFFLDLFATFPKVDE